jgi:hypothetical protein
MPVPITKIQILTDSETRHPLFYCHSADEDHEPDLLVRRIPSGILVESAEALYKVKKNPQRKNRVDIYMSLESARALGKLLLDVAGQVGPSGVRESKANPAANASGRMQLPRIVWSRYARCKKAGARLHSGTMMQIDMGYVNVDLEAPVDTFIKMTDEEIHIGVSLGPPQNEHDESKTTRCDVPESELQRGTGETNPIYKVAGGFYFLLDDGTAAGLGQLLASV